MQTNQESQSESPREVNVSSDWRLLILTFIITNLFFRETSKKLAVDNKLISLIGAFIFCFLANHYNQIEQLRFSLHQVKPLLITTVPPLSLVAYTFNVRFGR